MTRLAIAVLVALGLTGCGPKERTARMLGLKSDDSKPTHPHRPYLPAEPDTTIGPFAVWFDRSKIGAVDDLRRMRFERAIRMTLDAWRDDHPCEVVKPGTITITSPTWLGNGFYGAAHPLVGRIEMLTGADDELRYLYHEIHHHVLGDTDHVKIDWAAVNRRSNVVADEIAWSP